MTEQTHQPPSTTKSTTTTNTTTFFPDTDPAVNPIATKISHGDPPPSSATTPPNHQQVSHPHPHPQPPPQTLSSPDNTIQITLTHAPLSTTKATTHTRSPTAGATVLFLGTTRSYFQDPTRPVSRLSYTAYAPLALRTLLTIATALQSKHGLEKIYIAHRLGEVAVAEESIVVAVSAPHRGPAWAGAEEMLELVKQRAEIWKREWFVDGGVEEGRDGEQGSEVGVWRDNRESDRMGKRKSADADADAEGG